MAWHDSVMIAFDVETTGTDPETARIVSACAVQIAPPDPPTNPPQWLINPGVEIPAEAVDVHGITTKHARKHGQPPAKALEEITTQLADAMSVGLPLVGMNLSYDLTVLDRECRRHGLRTLEDRLGQIRPVIDILVIDKHVDRYRPGGRRLGDMCAAYGVTLDDAHDAAADAVAAAHVAWVIGERTQQSIPTLARIYQDRRSPNKLASNFSKLGALTLAELHDAQVKWRAEQVASLAKWRRERGEPLDDEDGSWPVRPYRGAGW